MFKKCLVLVTFSSLAFCSFSSLAQVGEDVYEDDTTVSYRPFDAFQNIEGVGSYDEGGDDSGTTIQERRAVPTQKGSAVPKTERLDTTLEDEEKTKVSDQTFNRLTNGSNIPQGRTQNYMGIPGKYPAYGN